MSADFLLPLVEAYKSEAEKANQIATEAQGAKEGAQAKSLKEWRETAETPEAKKYRENVEKAQAAIAKWREEIDKIGAKALNFAAPKSEDELKAMKESYKTHATAAKKARTLLTEVAETLKVDLPEIPALLNFGSGKPAGERTGSTGTRTRWSKVEFTRVNPDGTKSDLQEVKRLSDVVADVRKHTGVVISATDLSNVVFEEAGTNDPDKITSQEFVWTESKDGNTYTWNVTVYRDPKSAESAETEESDENETDDDEDTSDEE